MKAPKILNQFRNQSIFQLQAKSNYTYLFHTNGKKEISAYTLKVFESLFDNEEFVKIDRSNIVKKDFISKIIKRNNTHLVKLFNSTEITIPRRRWREMKAVYLGWGN